MTLEANSFIKAKFKLSVPKTPTTFIRVNKPCLEIEAKLDCFYYWIVFAKGALT